MTKTERFLASFQAVGILSEHRNHNDEGSCLRDCGLAPSIASKIIRWAESTTESLVLTFEYRATGRVVACWHWKAAYLQAAFRKHTELFGDDDLPPAAKRMRDTGSFHELT